MPTITAKHGFGTVTPVVAPFIEKAFGGNYRGAGSGVNEPVHTITTVDHNRLITPYLIQYHQETAKHEVRGQNVSEPVMTLDTSNRYGLVMSYMTKFYHTGCGQGLNEPIHTITTSPGHFGTVSVYAVPAEELLASLDSNIKEQQEVSDIIQKCTWVSQFIIEYYGQGTGQPVTEPLHTIVTKDRFALITVLGNEYVIMDIFLRMLKAEELKLAQGFPKDYIIDRDYKWKKYPIKEQVARIGNSVVPIMAQALVNANCPYLKVGERQRNMMTEQEQTGQIRFA